jgi:hypothetical protein
VNHFLGSRKWKYKYTALTKREKERKTKTKKKERKKDKNKERRKENILYDLSREHRKRNKKKEFGDNYRDFFLYRYYQIFFFHFSFCLYFSHYHLFTFNSFPFFVLIFLCNSSVFLCNYDTTVKLNFLITQDFGNERNKYYYCNGIETNGLLVCRCYLLNDTFLLISSINISSKVLLFEMLVYLFNISQFKRLFGGKNITSSLKLDFNQISAT